METAAIRARIWRGHEEGQFEEYEVPRLESQTVLDVVTYIQRHIDPTLSYRFACRVGMCGSCAMNINGIARWTCRTHVSKVLKGNRIEIAPLSNMPIVKDLVVDMTVFFKKWVSAVGQFHGAETREAGFAVIDPTSEKRVAAAAGTECIGCGICYSSCDVVTWKPDFLGPAALNRAWTLVNDVRDTMLTERLEAVAGDAGCHSCHTQGSCTERCPKHIAPSFSIAQLKVLTTKEKIRGEV